jgi:hypothetical protein
MAQATTPYVNVTINYPSCGARTMQVPIPSGTAVEGSNESDLVVHAPDGTEYDLYKATPPGAAPLSSGPSCSGSGTWAATVGYKLVPGWTGNGYGQGSPRGSGVALAAGIIRPRDTQTASGGTWDHALAMAYPGTCGSGQTHPRYVAPATTGDGTYGGTACIPMGARIQLDPSINCSTWATLKYEWIRQECRTLQRYGAIVVDTGAGFFAQDSRSLNGYTYPWSGGDTHLPSDLMSHFRVIDWTQFTG